MDLPANLLLIATSVVLGAVLLLYLTFRLRFERWKAAYTRALRQDAVQRSQSAVLGKVVEHLVPYLPEFRWNPRDARFLGAPVDFVVFDGLSEGALRRIVFVEVKTGSGAMTNRERQVRDAVQGRHIEWEQLSLPELRIRRA